MRANKKYFNVRVFKDPLKVASVIYHEDSLEDVKNSQNKMLAKLDNFQKYNRKKPDTIQEKTEVLINAEGLYNIRNKVIEAFEDGFFPYNDGFQQKESDVVNKKIAKLGKSRRKKI